MVALPGLSGTTVLDSAQVAREFTQRSWQKKDGLPDNTVQALLQTRDGFLWIGTSRGLARFDGLKFTVFDHLNTPALPDDNCRALAEDAEGNVWVATDDGLIRCRNGAFRRLTKQDGLTSNDSDIRDQVGAVCADRSGAVWCIPHWSVDRFQDGKFTRFLEAKGVPYNIMYALHEDSHGVIWAAGGRLHRFDRSKREFEIQPEQPGHGMAVACLQDSDDGGLWVLGWNNRQVKRFWLYHYHEGSWTLVCEQFPVGFRGAFLEKDRWGDLWMSADGELDRFRNGQFTRYLFSAEFPSEHVVCFLEDRNGSYWFGTEQSGLHCWKPRATSACGVRDGLVSDSTWTLGEARDGSVWIGTEQGLSQFKDGRYRTFTKAEGLTGDKIRSVGEDVAGNLWVGTSSGLSVIRNGVASRQEFPHRLEMDKTRVVCPTKDNALWVGTVDGLFRLQHGAWTTFRTTNGLANADVRALCKGGSGTLWIGTAGGGLQRFHDGRFETWTTTNGLSNNSVWAFHEDADGVLWIGTESGLNRFANGKFTTFTTREGLPVDLVNEILEDDFGNLWISHDHGLYRVRRAELNEIAAGRTQKVQAVSYDEADGLPSNETNGQKSYPAGCKTRDGRLWFPTTKGVAVIDPKLCDRDTIAPQAAVEQVRVDGEVMFDNAGLESRLQAATHPDRLKAELQTEAPLRLPPGSGRVMEFRFTAPVFTAPEKASFRYRLRGADDRWIEAGTRREAYFTRLRPGNYEFEVLAANHRGVWGQNGARFAVSIQPFYYQTWWFYLACGLGTTGFLSAAIVWRIREMRKLHRLEQQSAIADERTRIAKDLHDGLGADLTRLTLLADLAGGDEGGGEHARKLSQTSRAAARELREMIWIANPANDSAEGLVARICQTAAEFLGDARIRCRLEVAAQLPQRPLKLEQRRNLLLVAREALNNIVKHAAATEVRIRASAGDGALCMAIEDNGRGFDPARARAAGLGLASMKRRMESSGGTFEIRSHPGGGTRILITVQLEAAGP